MSSGLWERLTGHVRALQTLSPRVPPGALAPLSDAASWSKAEVSQLLSCCSASSAAAWGGPSGCASVCEQAFLRLGLWLISGVRNLGNIGGDGARDGSWGREAAAPQDTTRVVFGHLCRKFSKLFVEGCV